MNGDLAQLLQRRHGAVHLDDALTAVPRHVIKHALARGHIVNLLPAVYVQPERSTVVDVRERAAVLYAGQWAVLSHVSALRRWGLAVADALAFTVHVTVPSHVRCRGRPNVVTIHRTQQAVPAVSRGGLLVTRLERSIVDSWPFMTGAGSARSCHPGRGGATYDSSAPPL